MSLINEYYDAVGRRLELWEEQTGVTFTIKSPPNPEAIPQPYRKPMDQTPAFGALDDAPALNRDALLTALNTGAVTVEFKNADGELKTMLCTLWETAIPTDQLPKDKPLPSLNEVVLAPNPNNVAQHKVADPNLIKVYAIDRQGWRSFRFERLVSFTPYYN